MGRDARGTLCYALPLRRARALRTTDNRFPFASAGKGKRRTRVRRFPQSNTTKENQERRRRRSRAPKSSNDNPRVVAGSGTTVIVPSTSKLFCQTKPGDKDGRVTALK